MNRNPRPQALARPFTASLAVALAAVLAAARPAAARIEVIAGDPAAAPADARFPQESGLVAEALRFDYRCEPSGDGMTCALVERLRVHNPTERSVTALALLDGAWGVSGGSVTVDGAPAQVVAIGAPEGHAIECARHVAVYREPVSACPEGGDWQGTPVRFTVAPGAASELVLRGRRETGGDSADRSMGGLGFDAQWTRHPFMAAPFWEGATEVLVSEVTDVLTLRGNPRIDVRIDAPSGWTLVGRDDPLAIAHAGGRVIGALQTDAATCEARRIPERQGARVSYHIAPLLLEATVVRPGAQRVANGGPFIGVGARLDDPHVRFRGGWEVAVLGPSLLASLAVDVDTAGAVVLAPTFGVAGPFVPLALLLPSLGVGVGPAFALQPDTRVGLRVVGTASWPVLGVDVAMDYYPASGGRASDVQWSVLGRLGY